MTQRYYYWESEDNHGAFQAPSDEVALERWQSDWWVLYRESDTDDGVPFLYLKEQGDDESETNDPI